jgi:hypothetical protein
VRIVNKTIKDIPLSLRLENAPGRIIEVEGRTILVQKEGQGKGSFFVVLPKSYVSKRKTGIRVGLYQGDKRITSITTNFMGPFNRLD